MSPTLRYGIPLALLALTGGARPALAQVTQDYSTTIIAPFYANVASFDTTTTTSSPTFTRPGIFLGTVTPPPLGPSGIGTAVGYATHDFTPTDNNQYRVTTIIDSGYAANNTAGTSNLVQVLYHDSFDPTDKTYANASLAYNPPGSVGSYVTSLTAGTKYTFVNGGRYNATDTNPAHNSLGTVTTKVDEYNAGTTMNIPQADYLGTTQAITQTLTLAGGGAINSFNSFTIVGLQDTAVGDLTAMLTHNGVTVSLFDQPANGGFGALASFNGSQTYKFADTGADLPTAALNAVNAGGQYADAFPLPGGTYKSLGRLAAFNGDTMAGDWTLKVVDNTNGSAGSFLGFSFNATSTSAAAPVPEASTWIGLGMGCLALTLLAVKRRRTVTKLS